MKHTGRRHAPHRTRHRTQRAPHHTSRPRSLVNRVAAWAAARRRTAVSLALRGACYGAGTGAASILAYWLEHHL
jgi:hypothetical protein